MSKLLMLLIVVAGLISCDCSGTRQNSKKPGPGPSRTSFEAQREFLEKERAAIQAYIKDRNLEVERSGTGMSYAILKDSAAGENAQPEDVVAFDYTISLMNGALLYSSGTEGPKYLKIDKQNAEIGLHEALKKLGVGDKGLFILPSHLAFGVAGDQNKVPPMTPLVYELEVINIQKSKPEK